MSAPSNGPIDYSNPEDVARLFDEDEKSENTAPPPQPHKPGFGRFGWRVILGLCAFAAIVIGIVTWNVVASINNQSFAAHSIASTDAPTTVASVDKAAVSDAEAKAKGIQKENVDQAGVDAAQKTGQVAAESDPESVDTTGMTQAQKDRLAGRRSGTNTSDRGGAAQRAEEARKRREEILNSTPIAVDNSAWFDENGNLKKAANASGAHAPTTELPTPRATGSNPDEQQTGEGSKLRQEQAKEMAAIGLPTSNRQGGQERDGRQEDTSSVGPNKIRTTQQPGATIAAYVDNLTGEDGRPLYRVRSPYFLHCSIKNKVNGALAGPVVCELSDPVWSEDRQHLLAPLGSVLVGDVTAVGDIHQERLFAAFHRMILPNGELVDLDTFKGLSIAGESGLAGKVNRHLLSMFAGAGAMAAIGAVASVGNTINTFEYSFSQQYRQQLTGQLGQVGTQLLTRFINRLPTIILRQNEGANVYVASDLLFSEYDPTHHVV